MKEAVYRKLANEIDSELILYREDDYVYLLYPNPPKNGNILIQELDSAIVIWSNDYKSKSVDEVFNILHKIIPMDLIFPYIETEEEFLSLNKLGAIPIIFELENCEEYSKKYGTFLLRKENK